MTTHNSARRIAAGLATLAVALSGTATAATAAPAATIAPVGRAAASAARVVNTARPPQLATAPATSPAPRTRRPLPGPALPISPRPAIPARASAATSVSSVFANFDGATSSNCTSCQFPSDVNAAVGRTRIAEATNVTLDVFTKAGTPVCRIPYSTLLQTSDGITDPRIVYDNVFGRFVTVVTVVPRANTKPPAAIWVAVTTQSESPCGSWFAFRVAVSPGAAPLGDILDFPYLALDFNSILLEADTSRGGVLWAIPKSAAYGGTGFNVPVFPADIDTTPVTNGGNPMRASTNTYFIAARPGTGYNLYRMTDSAGPNVTFSLQAAINAPFAPPSRPVRQPNSTVTLDSSTGTFLWSPVLAANNLAWFAHPINSGGFPTIQYGAIDVTNNTVRTALAFHDGISDDFNPSISVGDNPSGTTTVFLNWAFTDADHGISATPTVNSVVLAPGASPPNLLGTDTALVTGGGNSTGDRFGDLSSVAIDPAISTGTCAVTGQQYYAGDGNWKIRIARIGTC